MVQLTSNHLNNKENSLIKKYAKFVLDRFVRRGVQNKAKIHIKILKKDEIRNPQDVTDMRRYRAWCTYDGLDENENKKFTVVIVANALNKRAKKPITKLKSILIDVGHELVHVKQYLNNEIFDYVSGDVRYKGSYFDNSWIENEDKYFDSPWEVDAYGREFGLYVLFCRKLKEEQSK